MVMVSPLDWGLGHATRCIPLIDALVARGMRVLLAGDGRSLQLLRRNYPEFPFEELPSYAVRYSKGRRHVLMLLRQLPHIIRTVKAEHQRTEELIDKYGLSAIISDNRYGPWTKRIPCVVMSHQLAVMPPDWLEFTRRSLFNRHMKLLHRFNQVWVPDFPGKAALSGTLTQAFPWPVFIHAVGPLSRFTGKTAPDDYSFDALKGRKPKVAVILSGPEPQRTILEEKILEQAITLNLDLWLVRGLPESNEITVENGVTRISFMDRPDLHRMLADAEVVISRSGYSSLLDYAAIGRNRLVLIPTPGQSEQEYLARYWAKMGWSVFQEQNTLDLGAAVEEAKTRINPPGGMDGADLLQPLLDTFLKGLG